MKNVVFFTGSLQLGGTEAKLARNFLPVLKERGKVNPKLLLLQERGEFLNMIPDGMEKLSLNETLDTNLFRIIPRFRDALIRLKADTVVSCMWYPAIISYLARKFGRTRFEHIVHDTVHMTEYVKDHFAREKYRWLKIYLTKKAYCDADAVVVVSHGEKKDLILNFKIPEEKIAVIYNPLDRVKIAHLSAEDPGINFEMPVVVSVGRLVRQKGFDLLLKAFKMVRDVMAAKLMIIGEGEKREELESLTRTLRLQDDVIFTGMQANPFKYMRTATIFCLASRYEGLGNVILEAMALGLPVVVTDCPSGPGEIVDGGKYGLLVPRENVNALADALISILLDNKIKKKLSDLSMKRACDFDLQRALNHWEDVILKSSLYGKE